MLGSRSIWHEGWKAVTTHPTLAGWGHFNDDEWELYNTDTDRAEVNNLAAAHPDKVRELVNIWFSEAGANGAFPLDDRSPVEIMTTPRPQLTAPRNRYVYRPGAAVPEWQAVNTRNRSFAIGAVVAIPAPGAHGVLFSMGSRFGGHALYVKDNRLHYVNSFVGSIEQHIVGSEDVPTGDNVILSAAFEKDGNDADGATGTLSLYHGDHKVGEGRIKTQLGAFAIAGVELVRRPRPRRSDHRGLPRRVAVRVHGRHDRPRRDRRQRRALRRHGTRGRPHADARVMGDTAGHLASWIEANGFTTYIASGGDRDFMRPFADELYGVPPERVIGSAFGLEYQAAEEDTKLLYKSKIEFFDDGPEKPVRIWSRIGRRPLLACGNSNGDVQMLRFARVDSRPSLRILILHDDAEREFDYTAGAEEPSNEHTRRTGRSSAPRTTGTHSFLATCRSQRPSQGLRRHATHHVSTSVITWRTLRSPTVRARPRTRSRPVNR